jgi:YD repeat-containing protein
MGHELQVGATVGLTRLYGTPDARTPSFTYEPIYNRPASILAPLSRSTTLTWNDAQNTVMITNPRGHSETVVFRVMPCKTSSR